jgi:hypothetical protein
MRWLRRAEAVDTAAEGAAEEARWAAMPFRAEGAVEVLLPLLEWLPEDAPTREERELHPRFAVGWAVLEGITAGAATDTGTAESASASG